MPGARLCSNTLECGIGLSDHAIHMELSYMLTRPDRLWLLETWYNFDAQKIAKFMPVGASQQTTKRKSLSKLSGNSMVNAKVKNALRCGWASHYDRFTRDSDYRRQCVSQMIGKVLHFEHNDESFDRYAEQEYFDKHGIDPVAVAAKENLVEELQGIGEDIFVPPVDEFDLNADPEGDVYVPPEVRFASQQT